MQAIMQLSSQTSPSVLTSICLLWLSVFNHIFPVPTFHISLSVIYEKWFLEVSIPSLQCHGLSACFPHFQRCPVSLENVEMSSAVRGMGSSRAEGRRIKGQENEQ